MTSPSSETLRRVDFESESGEEFRRDIPKLFQLSDEELTLCLSAILQMAATPSVAIRRRVEDLLAGISGGAAKINGATQSLWYLLGAFARPENTDTPELVVEDLVALEIVGRSETKRAIAVLTRVKDEAINSYGSVAKRHRTSRGVLPALVSTSSTVELRAITKRGLGAPDASTRYTPDLQGFVPVASVAITTDADDERLLYFQVDRSGLVELIALLEATLTDIDAIEESIPRLPERTKGK